jgi:hypothetical protein
MGARERIDAMSERYLVRTGGLLRCCLGTLEERMPTCAEEPKDGETLNCGYCVNVMVFHDGAWEWNKEASLPRWEKKQ